MYLLFFIAYAIDFFCFGLFLAEVACECLSRLWVFLGVYAWRQCLSAELLEFIISHNKPRRSRTGIGSGHLKMFQ